MEDTNRKQISKEKGSNNIKISSQINSKFWFPENSLLTNKINKKRLSDTVNEGRQIKSKFVNKLELPKGKEIDDFNKHVKLDNYKKHFLFDSDKKLIRNSASQDLIVKILEINKTESFLRNNSLDVLFFNKNDAFSNNINSIKSNRKNINTNPKIIESKEESKISNKKNQKNKPQVTFQQIKNKNINQDTLKNKNNITVICKSGTEDFRKHKNIKTDSSYSFFTFQNENEYKYNSSITDNFKVRLKKADILSSLHQLSEDNSSTKLRKVQNIMEFDLAKLQKEVYEYENTDVTDAINRLPTYKFNSDKNKDVNENNKHILKHFKIKNNKRKKIKKSIKNIKERFRILRRMGYVYDSLDDEEYEDEENNNFYFDPKGHYILILDSMILVSSLFYLVFLPIHLSYSPFNEKKIIKDFVFIYIDVIFIIDFVSGFFTAYINFDEDLIKNSVLIIQNYFNTWFLFDFLCGIPVYSILKLLLNKFENNTYHENCYFNYSGRNLYYLFEMIKLLKIIKVFSVNIVEKKIEQKIKKISFFYYWGHFIKQVLIFISIINISSCLFIFSARNSYPNWILNSNMNMQNFIPIYICSCYYIITTITTVGYGDIQTFSMIEKIFEILFLIIGTCLYSWMLTYVSNYIKKMNEENIKFEEQKEILDNIKTNYPLMSLDLYRKIYKLLNYKKTHKDVDKNIIIDSLPYSIKNNLLTQMYYPIITNFKFFKYFENSEFIIEIVSVLKPLLCIKGDLLINEGDYVEDIIFNKSGILSLEICIDLNNPFEFIEQYIKKYNLEKIKNKKYIDSNIEFNSTFKKNSLIASNYSKESIIFSKINNSIIKSNNNLSSLLSIKNEKSILDREKINKTKFQCLKILNIREKEHFGDVLMFLNEPSPLNVRVNSKNVEVLLLNKTDVVKISSNFPNIWKKVNEKSIFNLEQIKNLIMRKLSIFCISNGIKIKSLYYRKDTKTGQNKIGYSLIPIPDPTQEEILNQNNNLNGINDKISKDSENNSSQNFENSNEKNTFVIKEVESSEENRSNSIITKEIKNYSEKRTMSKKRKSKNISDNINIQNQKKYASDKNIHYKRNSKYYDQKVTDNQNQSFTNSISYRNLCKNEKYISSNKNLKNSIIANKDITNKNANNIITKGNYSSKKSYFSNNIKKNNISNSNVISSPKEVSKYQNFTEKSKMNNNLISIPQLHFMEDSSNLDCESKIVNDEFYPNENFEIKIPKNDQNLIINNIKQEKNSITNFSETQQKLLIIDKNNIAINIIKEGENHVDVFSSLNVNNKFNNLKISSISKFEIKSSYDNINKFTNYKFISDYSLVKKTKLFLSKECGLLYDLNLKFANMSYTPTHNERRKSKSTEAYSKCLPNKKFYDYVYNIDNLSIINDNDMDSSSPFSKEIKKIEFKKIQKGNEKFFDNSLKDNSRGLSESFSNIKRISTIKEENEFPKKGNSTCKNMFSNFSPNNRKRKTEISSDNLVNLRTKNKLDLIMKNMERDSRNLNNPNEFYADLFNNIYKKKIKKNESKKTSLPKIKVAQSAKMNKLSKESEEEAKENSFYNN